MIQKKDRERYNQLVWMAWEQYDIGHSKQMANFLEESLNYTPFLRTETISDWVRRFSKFSGEIQRKFDATHLSDLPEWRKLIASTLNVGYVEEKTVNIEANKVILFIGHDLRFVGPIIEYYRQNHEVLIDEWKATNKHDEKVSYQLLEKADVIFCEWCVGNAVWYSRNKKSHQRMFIRLHKFELFTEYPKNVTWENVEGIIFIAHKMQETGLSKFDMRTKSHLVYNCIHTKKFDLPKKPGYEFNLGMLGYLPQTKRIDLAIEVLLKLKAQDKRYKLFVKGKHPTELGWLWEKEEERKYYEAVFERLKTEKITDSVIFDGYGQDVPQWFQGIGFVLSISDVEGSHQAVAEGMSSGTIPMISGGYYHDYGASLLYPQRYCCESVTDIARRIHILNQNESLRKKLEKEVKYFAQKNFNAPIIFAQWDALLLRKPCPFNSQIIYAPSDYTRVLLYADININVIDGSSIWITSLINTLNLDSNFQITLLLKAPLINKTVIDNIDNISRIEIIDPFAGQGLLPHFQDEKQLTVEEAVKCLIKLEKTNKIDTILIRSSVAVKHLRDNQEILSKCIFYALKNIEPEDLDTLNNCKSIAVQTPELQQSYLGKGIRKEKTFILPPMVKDVDRRKISFERRGFNVVYSGKLSAGYNALEIIKAFKYKLSKFKHYQLHLIVAKVMRSDAPDYTKELKKMLNNNNDERIKIYHQLSRDQVLEIIAKSDIGISWRSPEFDSSLELSTKLLEYSSLGKPVILNRNLINESFYGPDYPLYANTEKEFCDKIQLVLSDRGIYRQASEMVFRKGQEYMFSRVSRRIRSQFMANDILDW